MRDPIEDDCDLYSDLRKKGYTDAQLSDWSRRLIDASRYYGMTPLEAGLKCGVGGRIVWIRVVVASAGVVWAFYASGLYRIIALLVGSVAAIAAVRIIYWRAKLGPMLEQLRDDEQQAREQQRTSS